MIPPVLIDIARNMYGAGAGAAHPSAVLSALYGAMWNESWNSALAAGQAAHRAGGDNAAIEQAFRDALAEGLGWSHAEMNESWNSSGVITPEGSLRFDEDWDAFFDYVAHHGGGR